MAEPKPDQRMDEFRSMNVKGCDASKDPCPSFALARAFSVIAGPRNHRNRLASRSRGRMMDPRTGVHHDCINYAAGNSLSCVTVSLFSTSDTPGADQAAYPASSRSAQEPTLPRRITLLPEIST